MTPKPLIQQLADRTGLDLNGPYFAPGKCNAQAVLGLVEALCAHLDEQGARPLVVVRRTRPDIEIQDDEPPPTLEEPLVPGAEAAMRLHDDAIASLKRAQQANASLQVQLDEAREALARVEAELGECQEQNNNLLQAYRFSEQAKRNSRAELAKVTAERDEAKATLGGVLDGLSVRDAAMRDEGRRGGAQEECYRGEGEE